MEKTLNIIITTTLSAILLWISVNMSYEYQIAVAVPLVIENLPADKAISTPLPRVIQIKFRGNGWRSAALKLGADIRCILDVNSLPTNKRGLVLNDIVDRIAMPLGIQPVDMKPESVLIGFDKYAERRVPVSLNAEITFRSGYGQVGPVEILPESVTIGGAASLLPTIHTWPTTRSSLTDLKSPLDVKIPLAEAAFYSISPSPPFVRVRIDIQQFAEKTIAGLPVEISSVPQNREVILIPPKMDIVVRGGVQQLPTLTNDSFRASVDYNIIVADSTGYTDVSIASPKGVQLVNKKPERMQFIIRTRL